MPNGGPVMLAEAEVCDAPPCSFGGTFGDRDRSFLLIADRVSIDVWVKIWRDLSSQLLEGDYLGDTKGNLTFVRILTRLGTIVEMPRRQFRHRNEPCL